jgi:hypothetical protein
MIRNMNTIEEYRALDMNAILNQAGRTVSNECYPCKRAVVVNVLLDMGRDQRRDYILLPVAPVFVRDALLCGFEEVQVHLRVRVPGLAFRLALGI